MTLRNTSGAVFSSTLKVLFYVIRFPVPRSRPRNNRVCKAGDFLVAEIDAKVGGFGIVPDELDGAIVSSHYFLFDVDEEKLNRRFLDYFIRTPTFSDQVTAQGSTNYAAIRPNDVLGYEIPLPPLPEQRRIVARIEELAAKINEARGLRQQAVQETARIYGARLSQCMEPNGKLGPRETVGDVILSMDAGWSPQCDDIPARDGQWGVRNDVSSMVRISTIRE